MSKALNFRLSKDNPRETRAREVLNARVEKGYSVRYAITETLLSLDNRTRTSPTMGDFPDTIDCLASLVTRLENGTMTFQKKPKTEPELKESFLLSIKTASKPGLRIENG